MVNLVILCVLVMFACSIYTSPKVQQRQGIDITDGILQQFRNYYLNVETKCSEVDLKSAPYNYDGTVLSGYLRVGKGQSALAFIFYGKQQTQQSKLNEIPTILWLNGGPGTSSQQGNFFQLGPFWLKTSGLKTFDVVRNNYSWVKDYNIIFVDQPVGTGLSYADPNFAKAYVTNMNEMANDFYEGLKELYLNPVGCFKKIGINADNPLFIFGQGYGGKYAPAIGLKILKQAKENKGFLKGLKGIAIGNGFTDPSSTLSMVGQYAYNFGLIDYQQRMKIEQNIFNASYQELHRQWRDLHISFNKAIDLIKNGSGGVNPYDITKYQPYPTSLLQIYFATTNVSAMYGLDSSIQFGLQANNVAEALYQDFMKSQVSLVQNILANYETKVMVYTGQNDLYCNTPGTLRWVENLRFPSAEQFRDTLLTPFRINNEVKGFYKRVGNLQLRTINNAGQLVPMDQGEVALTMVNDFIRNALGGSQQPADNIQTQ